MLWQEFAPGETPPAVGMPGDPGVDELFVAASMGTPSTFEFGPLPAGLFNSDGQVSKHIFGRVDELIWTAVDVDGDGTGDLEACSASCFASGV